MKENEDAGYLEDLLPPKPEEPDQADCCGTGCTPCVFDIHQQEMRIWEEACRRIREGGQTEDEAGVPEVISQSEYKPFIIDEVTSISRDTKIFKFRLPPNKCLGLHVGQHIILRSRGLTCPVTRQYTPISDLKQKGSFDVLVKVYPHGKMSKYVETWKPSDEVLWRGPFGDFTYQPNQYKKLLVLAVGTGIAPMVQVIRHVLDNEDDEIVVKLFYGCQTFADILLKHKLDEWSSYWNFSVQYFLSQDHECNVKSRRRYADVIHFGRINQDFIKKYLEKASLPTTLVLTSGTKSFDKDMINFCSKCGLDDKNIFKF